MSEMQQSIQDYVARQPQLAGRRKILRAVLRALLPLFFKMEYRGVENIPSDGGAVVMINHTSLLDPIVCVAAVTHRFVIPMSKAENLKNPITAPFVKLWGTYTINRTEIDRKALLNSIELMKSGELILISPEGTRQKNGLIQPKEGFAYIVTKADAIIVPAAISGAIDWHKKLLRLRRAHIIVNFGVPFRFIPAGRVPRELLPVMMDEAMYQLSAVVTDETMRGVYSDLSQATTEHLKFLVD